MSDLTHLSLFSGIGGLDLAAEWAGFRTVGQCEWADYPRDVLEKHWPGLPRWRDIRTLTGDDFYEKTGLRTVTVLSGGFPCQPFSTAGKRRGKDDDRYLWPEMLRVISEIRPSWVVGENVAGLIRIALDEILSELQDAGYEARAYSSEARDVGGCLKASESLLWPRPTTGAPLCGGTYNFRQMEKLRDSGIITEEERKNLTCGSGGNSNPALMEWLMWFPLGWTDLSASETPSCTSSSTPSSGQ